MKQFFKTRGFLLLLLAIGFFTLLLLLQVRKTGENYRFWTEDSISFENAWEYAFDDGTCGVTDLPAKLETGDVTELVLTNHLPQLPKAPVSLIMKISHAYCRIYVGGELRYDSAAQKDGDGINSWVQIPGSYYAEAALHESDSGKEIQIVISGLVKRYVRNPASVYLGDRASFVIMVLHDEFAIVVGAVMLNLLAFIMLALWVILLHTAKTSFRDILCLFFFTFLVAGWEISEAQMIQFFRPNMRFMSVMAEEFLMLIPIPIALYFYYSGNKLCRKLATIAAIVPTGLWVGNNLLQILHVAYLPQTLIVTQVVLVADTLFIGLIQIMDIMEERRKQKQAFRGVYWKFPLVGLCIMVPLIVIALIEYILRVQNGGSTVLVSVGIVAYIFTLAFRSAFRLGEEIINARSASETKTQFLANMSHEIRTPLNAILGFDEIILRDSKEARTKEYAQSIQTAGESLRDIINTILDMSKIESGKIDIEETGYGVAQQLDAIVEMIAELAERKGLNFVVDVDENLPAFMMGDTVHIRQVLINILNNAVKYTKEGSVTFTVKLLETDSTGNECQIYFSVKDTGVGIREEDRYRLFKKFERLNNAESLNTEGTGLGMSIVVRLLEAMGSHIELDSEFGKGSDFHFVLKQHVIGSTKLGVYERGASKVAESLEAGNTYIAPSARILVVDDVPLNLQVTCVLLDVLKMTIDTAESGYEALDLVKQHRYDLILMDHMMPGMDGIQAAQKIRSLSMETGDAYYETVPIVALTANAMTGMRETFLDNGMQDYISKPVDGKQLTAAVRKWLPAEKIEYQESIPEEEGLTQKDWEIAIPGIYVDAARTYFPSVEEYRYVLATFLHAVESNTDKLNQTKSEGRWEDYCITVHGLKSSAKVIGANDLSEKARVLEEAAHTGDIGTIREHTDELLTDYHAIAVGIQTYLKSFTSGMTQIDDMELHRRLDALYQVANDFDMEGLMQWEKENENTEVAEKFTEDWNKIMQMVRDVSFMEIVDFLDKKREEGN